MTLPNSEPMYEDLGSECWPEQDTPELVQFEPTPPWVAGVGRAANRLLITAAILGVLWIAGTIFVAFHSGRVSQITRNIQAEN